MLSRSDSWGPAAGYSDSSESGAVLERPVCESVFGVTFGPSSGEGGDEALRGSWETLWDLTGVEGEILSGAGGAGDMERRTLVRLPDLGVDGRRACRDDGEV